jgi:hypothetical protein
MKRSYGVWRDGEEIGGYLIVGSRLECLHWVVVNAGSEWQQKGYHVGTYLCG